MQTFLVGGAVRDSLLNIPHNDLDWVVVGSSPNEMRQRGFKQVGADFPVFLDPETGDERALARTERKTGMGYLAFSTEYGPDVTLTDDLQRRDLTINSMAMFEDGTVFDPFGGQRDLKNRLLRHTSEAFAEDPVRVLRVARQAAKLHHLGFTIADDTLQLMQEMVSVGELDHLVPERVLAELEKTPKHDNVRVFFEVLQTCGAIDVIFGDFFITAGTLNLMDRIRELTTGKRPDLELVGLFPFGHCGTKRIVHMGKKAKMSAHTLEVARLVSSEHMTLMEHDSEMEPMEVLHSMRVLDVFRRMENRVDDVLIVCEAFFLTNELISEADIKIRIKSFREKADAVRNVDHRDLVEAGVTGKDMFQAIQKRQLDVLSERRILNTLSRMTCPMP